MVEVSFMLLQYFGLKEEPFGVSPDPRRLFLSQTHREALEGLQSGFSSNRGFTAMIAPPGMGKTTLLFRFLEQIRETARVVFLFDMDSTCEPREFVAYILRDLGIVPAQGSAEMHDQLSEVLVQENQAGRRFVIVIDEAQNLSDAVLERVRLLTNFESSKGKLIQVVLSGQPQLSDKLLQGSLLQLRQRISTVCHIKSLSIEETIGYINYRVKMAGYLGQPLFTEGAMRLIAQASQGTPRTINNLCFNALTLCCKLKSKEVDIAMVAKVISALQLIPPSREPYVSPAAVAAPFASVSAPSVPSAAANQAPEQSRKRKEFAGLQLTPQSSEPLGARTEAARTEAARPVAARTNDSAAASVDQTTQRPWKRKEFSGLQLTPQSGDHIAATSDKKPAAAGETSDQPAEQKFWQRTKLRVLHLFPATAGTVMLWVPAAAVILVMSFVGVLRLTEVFSPASLTSDVNQTTEMSVPPPTDTDEPAATKSVPSPSTSDHSVNNPASATAPAPAATPRPMQATATIPKPSPITVLPASPAARPAHATPSAPTHSAVTTSSSKSKLSQGNPSGPQPSAATQPVVTAPKTNAQSPSTSSVTTPVAPQQSQTPATLAPKQVRAALSGNTPAPATLVHSATAPSVHAALPQP
jgi:general secretion pathway protein A